MNGLMNEYINKFTFNLQRLQCKSFFCEQVHKSPTVCNLRVISLYCKTNEKSKTQFTMTENLQRIAAWDEDGGVDQVSAMLHSVYIFTVKKLEGKFILLIKE